jgi:AcrR family transcriptional regulator
MKGKKEQAGEPSRRKEKGTRSDILEVAARLIVEKGYNACTMRSISQELNIKAASLYYHFPSKDDIVVEIMNIGTAMLLDEVKGRFSKLPEGTSFKDALYISVQTHITCKLNLSTPFMRVYEHLPPIIKKQSRLTRRHYTKFWINLIESGKTSGDVRADLNTTVFAIFLLGGLNRVPEWFHPESMDISDVIDTVMLSLWDGVHADQDNAKNTWAPKEIDAVST